MSKTITELFNRMHDGIITKIAYEKCDVEIKRIMYQMVDELQTVFLRYKSIIEQKEKSR